MNTSLKNRYGNWAMVTGASSGIGKQFCMQLAELGFNLVITARRIERLNALRDDLITRFSTEIIVVGADLSAQDFMPHLIQATEALEIGLLINCAGFAITGEFISKPLTTHLDLMRVNAMAPITLCHHFGRLMAQRKRGGIINISSASAFLPIPHWATYSSSKVFLLHFSEALWHEMKHHNVDVLAVCPPSTDSEFSQIAHITMRGISPKNVVDNALGAIGKKMTTVVGFGLSVSLASLRLFSRQLLVRMASKIVAG
jgi:uncharacterized protein